MKRTPLVRRSALKRRASLRFRPRTFPRFEYSGINLPTRSRMTLTDLCRETVVSLRDMWCCQKCGREDTRVHWAHVKGRRAQSIVFAPWNSLALCGDCHTWFDSHKGGALRPGEGMRWWREKFPGRATMLDEWERGEGEWQGIDRERDVKALALAGLALMGGDASPDLAERIPAPQTRKAARSLRTALPDN